MARKGPVAPEIVADGYLGRCCSKCLGAVYLDRVSNQASGRILTVYRHVEQHPPCLERRP